MSNTHIYTYRDLPPLVESPVVESPMVESPVVESPMIESPMVESPMVKCVGSIQFTIHRKMSIIGIA